MRRPFKAARGGEAFKAASGGEAFKAATTLANIPGEIGIKLFRMGEYGAHGLLTQSYAIS